MPLYSFKCSQGDLFDAIFSLTEVPDTLDCPECQAPARRVITGVRLARGQSAAYQLVEKTQRSAHEPEVVSALPASGKAGPKTTQNPLHRKLPKP